LLNIFDPRDKDIRYFHTSRLPGIDDIHSRVVGQNWREGYVLSPVRV
jgi:hypothetical protein